MFDRVITVLHRRLDTETDADLTRFFGGVLAKCCPDSLTGSQLRCKEPTNQPAGGGRRPSLCAVPSGVTLRKIWLIVSMGDRVIVHGKLIQKSYETREGEKRITVELLVDEVGRAFTEMGKC